jgi:hypothetical protein
LNPSKFVIAVLVVFIALPLAAEPVVPEDKDCRNVSGFVIIGEMENVTFREKNLRLKARIDTGAQTSSLGVISHQPFERDGSKWLHFSVKDPNSEKLIDFERPLQRIAIVKRHGAESMERPVVKLKIMLANVEMDREFTLADRSKYTFVVLIGRNVLRGKYLVDVNRRYLNQRGGGSEE